ncbi:MAG: DUF4129 domain-containing protein [Pyrinomonadaceae bacterium]|nr:DUF4129 domain-containing protein [Pyrinomonadaceae bacterium]
MFIDCHPLLTCNSSVRIRCVFSILVVLLCAVISSATPLTEYQLHVKQAVSALDTLNQSDEGETDEARRTRITETLTAVRNVLPVTETVEWGQTTFKVDNTWLHRELERFERAPVAEREMLLTSVTERLQALAHRLEEIEKATATTSSKADATKRLGEILQREEYKRGQKEGSAFNRLVRDLWKWIESWFPKPQMSPGRASIVTNIAQIFVVVLALAVIAYAVKLFMPRVFKKRGTRKKSKRRPMIVMGEKLEPDQSSVDLLADAESLARRGELRAAIRKAYVALLVELGDRKVISLAQHKTNRDYLGAMRDMEPLYGNVKQLTDSFERHWYGFASATEADWLAFRSGYKQALSR